MVGGLLEREDDLAAIAAFAGRVAAGAGGVLLVEGPAGIGKTALLRHAALGAGRVARARGGVVERELTFGVARELLGPLALPEGGSGARRRLTGAARPARALLDPRRGDPPAEPGALNHALYWLAAGLAEDGPLLLVVDDAHWADVASVRWLAYLAGRIAGLPIGIVLAARTGEPSAAGEVLADLAASPGVTVLRPEALSPTATAAMLAQRLEETPADAFATACFEATRGNPFLIGELTASFADAGLEPTEEHAVRVAGVTPLSLRRSVLVRLARLPAAARGLARAVAVLGAGCGLASAAALAGIDEPAAADAAEALVRAQILDDRAPLSFAHPILRASVYEDLPGPVRAAEHVRAARVLVARGAAPEPVAAHLLAGEPVGEAWAGESLAAAGASALARGDPEAAETHLRRALAEPLPVEARARTLRSLASALARQGDAAAIGAARDAMAMSDEPAASVGLALELIPLLGAHGRTKDALALADDVRAVAGDAGPDLARQPQALLLGLQVLDGTGGAQDATDDPALTGATRGQRGLLSSLAVSRALMGGTAAEARELALLAVGDAHAYAGDLEAGTRMMLAPLALALSGDPELAAQRLATGIETARATGSIVGQAWFLSWLAVTELLRGGLRETEATAATALAALGEVPLRAPATVAASAGARAAVEAGRLDEAERLCALHGQGTLGMRLGDAMLLCARAQLRLAQRAPEQALADATAASALAEAAGWRAPGLLPWRSLAAEAHLALGDTAAAVRLAKAQLAAARRFGTARETGAALRVLGLAEGPAGHERLATSVARLRAAADPLELARSLVDHGAALRRARERRAAREPLAEGMELAFRLGADPLVARARDELRASGARPRNAVRTGIDALTPSERRVAELASEGLTNAEIGQALFITARTVESHLGSTFRKLGLSSRGELGDALQRRPADAGAPPGAATSA